MSTSSPSPPSSREKVPFSAIVSDYEWYSSNFLRIVNKAGESVPFVWNKPQYKLAAAVQWQMDRGLPIRVVVLKSRRVGISTWVQGFLFHRGHLRENRTGLTIAHKEDSALQLFDMQRIMYDNLPESGPIAAEKQYFTKRQIQFKATRSRTQIAVVGKGSGRGFNVAYLHLSEMAFYEDAKATLQAVKQGVPKIPDSAVFIESTPKGWGNAFHRSYLNAKHKRSGYVAVFIAWHDDPTCEMTPWFTEDDLDESEQEMVRLYGLNLRQLAWRRDTIANECDDDEMVFAEEYPSDDRSCFLASGRPAITKEDLDYQIGALPEPDPWEGLERCEIEMDSNAGRPIVVPNRSGRLVVIAGPIPRHQYVAGVDPSEGDPGSTASPIAILDQYDLSLAALWYGRTPPEILAEHAIRLCTMYNESLLIWEANNHGVAFGLTVREKGYGNVWMRRVSEESVAGEIADKPGLMNTTRNRQNLFNTLRKYTREARKNGWKPLRHPILVGELSTLVYEDDKAIGQEGALVDTLIALSLALYAHQGAADAPLEPLGEDDLRRLYGEIGWKLRMGILPKPEELAPYNITAEELEKLDELMDNKAKGERRRGLGRAT